MHNAPTLIAINSINKSVKAIFNIFFMFHSTQLCSLWAAALTLCLVHAPSNAQTPKRYSFAVVPQFSAAELHKDWAPLLQRLGKDTGLVLELEIAPSIPKFEAEFLRGGPDFAYMNPYHAVMARQAEGYVPLVRDSKPLNGVLVARKDGPHKTVRDLNGQTLGFPAPNSFGASLYMRALLTEEVKIKFDARYLGTHSNVYRHVARSETAAGGSVIAALNDEVPELRDQLVVLYKTPDVASHPVVAHPRVPESARKAVTQAMLALSQDETGKALLKGIRTPTPVQANYATDYQPLARLNIQKYVVVEKE